MPDALGDFDALTEEFYRVWFRYHPHQALIAGVPGYAARLPAQNDDDLAALGHWLETLVLELAALTPEALDAPRRLDYRLLCGAARIEHRDLTDQRCPARNPLAALPIEEIHQLTLTPPDLLREPLAEILAAVPAHLRYAQTRLGTAAASLGSPLVRTAIVATESGRCYLRDLIRGPWLRRHCPGFDDLESLAEGACDALADYRQFLRLEVLPKAAGCAARDAAYLTLRLGAVHHLDADLDRARGLLRTAIDETAAELAGLDGAQRADQTIPATDRAALYRRLADELAVEIRAKDLVTLPDAPLDVRVHPACPGAERVRTDYRRDGDGGGVLYLSTAGAETLAEARALCLAGSWGGSHLFAMTDAGRPRSLTRRLANGQSLTLGWGLYLEQRLTESGDRDRRRAALRRRARCLGLALVDLDLHTQGLTDHQLLGRLGGLGIVGQAGDAALTGLGLNPGDALAGALGWLLLEEARRCAEARNPAGFSARVLHDQWLAHGSVPVGLALEFGDDPTLWRDLSALLRGETPVPLPTPDQPPRDF